MQIQEYEQVQDCPHRAFIPLEPKMITNRLTILVLLLTIQGRPQASDEHLKLHAEIESERYCEVDNETSSLLVKFKVRLLNSGKLPIVLDQPIYPLLLVSRTLQSLQKHDHEFALHPPDVFDVIGDGSSQVQPVTHPNQVLVVRGGDTLETNTLETTVPTRRRGKSKAAGLAQGSHYVQVVLQGQIEGTESFIRATSQPLKITVQKMPKLENCR